MRLRIALLALALPSGIAAMANGCGPDIPPIEDFCGWIEDPGNCYRDFYLDVGAQCGTPGLNNPPVGHFVARDKLDICVLEQGGSVVFDPPLELSTFPLGVPKVTADGGVEQPASSSFKFIKANGEECGSASFTSQFSYSVTVNGCPVDAGAPPVITGAGGGGGGGAGGSTGAGEIPASAGCNRGGLGDEEGVAIAGGTFSLTENPGTQQVDSTCPTGEAHHFNELTAATKCKESVQLVPQAEILSNPGAVEKEGYVLLRVHFPPSEAPSGKSLSGREPEVVSYFYCTIPGAPKQCADGQKNGAETDVDCGGLADDEGCPIRCMDGAACFEDTDCELENCETNTATGLKSCVDPMMM